MSRRLAVLLIILLFLIPVLVYVYTEDIAITYSRDEGLRFQDQQSINHIIDYYVDQDGSYYYLDYEQDQAETYLYKVTKDGKLVFRKKMPFTVDEMQMYYKLVIVDEAGNIYISATVTPKDSRMIAKEVIRKYDHRGNYRETVHEVLQEEPVDLGNPFSAFSGRFINMQLFNETIYAFDKRSQQEVALLAIGLNREDEEAAVERKILQLDVSVLREIIYTAQGEIYFLNRQAQIRRITEQGVLEQVETRYDAFTEVIPYTLTADGRGNMYFTDAHSGNFVKLTYGARIPRVLYDLSHVVDEEKGVTLGDLRNIRVFNERTLAGHSMVSPEEMQMIATLEGASGKVVDQVGLTFGQALRAYGPMLALIMAGVLLLLLAGYYLSRRLGLLAKQLLIFLPVFLAIMIGVALYLTGMIRDQTVDMAYEKVASMAESSSQLIEADRIKSLDHPRDDFGPEFRDISQRLRVNREGIYYVTYFVEDNQVYVGVAANMQSHTPIDYLYDGKTVQYYQEVLRTGEIQLGSTIDSFGEWMFALAPIVDSQGQTVGILEQGWHAALIQAEVDRTQRNLLMLFSGIAIAAALFFVLMFKYSLRALDVLKLSVSEVAAGRWNTKVNIKTRDEFRDIGQAFNKMSDRIQDYIDEITELNQAYVKFVPERIISLLGKNTVLDVQSGEQVTGQMAVMYANVRNIEKYSKQMDIEENFHFVNQILEMIARKVNENQGLIERFEGAGAIALFKEYPENALVSSLRLMEELAQFNRESKQQAELGITISTGQVLLGIVGHENRLATTVISDEVRNAQVLEKISARLGIKLLLTRATVQELVALEHYQYRYAGRVKDSESPRTIEIFEFLDGYEAESKKLKLTTRPLLEEGIAFYQEGDFQEGRKKFIEVIRLDQGDMLAKAYLFLCEKYSKENVSRWEGILEYY